MANVCMYKAKVVGKKNACYAMFGSFQVLMDKEILSESGTDEVYTLILQGYCKWTVDQYTSEYDGPKDIDIPADPQVAANFGKEFWGYTVKSCSRAFGVEVWCNSADIDDPYGVESQHYIKGAEDNIITYEDMPREIEMDEYYEHERFLSGRELHASDGSAIVEGNDGNSNNTVEYKNLVIGDRITLGGITWKTLAVEGTNALMLADEIVTYRPYNKKCIEVTWETCNLRQWLNKEFYNQFSVVEKAVIIEVENKNPDNSETEVAGGNDTVDKVFILSLEELYNYLPEKADRESKDYWWIRTPGEGNRQALVVIPDGSIMDDEGWVEFEYGVRPAVWITLQ